MHLDCLQRTLIIATKADSPLDLVDIVERLKTPMLTSCVPVLCNRINAMCKMPKLKAGPN